MRLADKILTLYEEALDEYERLVRLELERVGLGLSRWLAAFWQRIPCDDWLSEIEGLFANLERDHVFVDDESRKAFIAWLAAVNAAAKERSGQNSHEGVQSPEQPVTCKSPFPPREQVIRPADERHFPDDLPSPFDLDYPQLGRAGNSIMQGHSADEWLKLAERALKSYQVPESIREMFRQWIAAEQQRRGDDEFGIGAARKMLEETELAGAEGQPAQEPGPVQPAPDPLTPAWFAARGYDKVVDGSNVDPLRIKVDGGVINFGVTSGTTKIEFAPNAANANYRTEFIQAVHVLSDYPKNDGVLRTVSAADVAARAKRGGVGSISLRGLSQHMISKGKSSGWGIDIDYGQLNQNPRVSTPSYNGNQPKVALGSRQMEDRPTFFFKGTKQVDEFITSVYAPAKKGNEWLGSIRWGVSWEVSGPFFWKTESQRFFCSTAGINGAPTALADSLDAFQATETQAGRAVENGPYNTARNKAGKP